jgi:hypothetical protein
MADIEKRLKQAGNIAGRLCKRAKKQRKNILKEEQRGEFLWIILNFLWKCW